MPVESEGQALVDVCVCMYQVRILLLCARHSFGGLAYTAASPREAATRMSVEGA